jgi:integrase
MKMKWSDIRGDVWTIPAEIAKNKQPHDVPLSEMALEIIEKMRPLNNESDYIFCSPKEVNAPMKWLTRARVTIQKYSDVDDFRPHDLRRTVATYMAKLSVDRTVLGKILNHKGLATGSQVTAIYDRHSYMKEKRQAMNRWSNHLQKILSGKKEANIIQIG